MPLIFVPVLSDSFLKVVRFCLLELVSLEGTDGYQFQNSRDMIYDMPPKIFVMCTWCTLCHTKLYHVIRLLVDIPQNSGVSRRSSLFVWVTGVFDVRDIQRPLDNSSTCRTHTPPEPKRTMSRLQS